MKAQIISAHHYHTRPTRECPPHTIAQTRALQILLCMSVAFFARGHPGSLAFLILGIVGEFRDIVLAEQKGEREGTLCSWLRGCAAVAESSEGSMFPRICIVAVLPCRLWASCICLLCAVCEVCARAHLVWKLLNEGWGSSASSVPYFVFVVFAIAVEHAHVLLSFHLHV